MSTEASPRPPVLAKASAAWPAIRGVLVALHVLAVVVLSLPSSGQLTDARRWESANTKVEMQRWAAMLEGWGIETTPESLAHRLRGWADGYARARRLVAAPFDRYAELSGARQGWSMFASPQKVPAELHVDVRVGSSWTPLVRPWDRTLDWRLDAREHHRVRKALGRLARAFRAERYEGLARWLATEAARDFPDVEEIRVALWHQPSPSIAQARAGTMPEGRYEHVLTFDAEALR
jgi:hypothetical protein